MSLPEPVASREHFVAELRRLFADDVITMDEYADHVGLVLAARDEAEMAEAVKGLPVGTAAPVPTPKIVGQRVSTSRYMVSIFGSTSQRGRWRMPARVRCLAVFGETMLDLRQASTSEHEVTIEALSVFGGVDVIVPEGVDVELTGVSIFGSKEMRVAQVPVLPGTPLVRVRAITLFGGVTVVSKTHRSDGIE
jgi:hypothetical protein